MGDSNSLSAVSKIGLTLLGTFLAAGGLGGWELWKAQHENARTMNAAFGVLQEIEVIARQNETRSKTINIPDAITIRIVVNDGEPMAAAVEPSRPEPMVAAPEARPQAPLPDYIQQKRDRYESKK